MPDLDSSPAESSGTVARGSPAAAAADLSAWIAAHCRDSVISRDTDTYNRVLRATADILSALSVLASRPQE